MAEISEILARDQAESEMFSGEFWNFEDAGRGRFAHPVGVSLVDKPLHRPDTVPSIEADGCTTSWPSGRKTRWFMEHWPRWKEMSQKGLINEVKSEVLSETSQAIETLSEKLGVDRKRIIPAESGSDAILLGKEILGDFSGSVGTTETGSDVGKGLKQKGKYTEIALREEGNRLISEDELFEKWRREIDQDENAYFILTDVSKTGVIYSNLTKRLLDYLEVVGKIGVVDAIQANGRVPKENYLRYLKHSACAGVVISGSKAFEASAHAGFLITSEKIENLPSNFQVKEMIPLIRIADNANAISENIEAGYLYSQRAKNLAQIYENFFASLGFELLRDEGYKRVNSIIAMNVHPALKTDVRIDKFTTTLARNGVTTGGVMTKERILRWGVLLDLVKDERVTPEALRKKLQKNLKPIFESAIKGDNI